MVITMRRGILPAIGCWLLLFAVGCRTNGNQELLERELRLMEDEIYHLEDDLEHFEAMLASCRRENAALRKQLAAGESSEGPGFDGGARPPQIDLGPPDATQAPATIEQQPGSEAPPFRPRSHGSNGPTDAVTPLPESDGPLPLETDEPPNMDEDDDPPRPPSETSLPRNSRDRRVSFPRETLDERDDGTLDDPALSVETTGSDAPRQSGKASQTPPDGSDDYMVARITLNRLLTGGVDQDNRPGDEGVMIVVEPRNASDQIINVPGELAVVVVDPNVREGDPRIARWDFSPDEVAERFRESLLAEGIHLEMPWPAVAPRNRQLHVHVRFVTADGKEFRADQPIHVEPPPPNDTRWQASQQRSSDMPPAAAGSDGTSAPNVEPSAQQDPSTPRPPESISIPGTDDSDELPHTPATRPLETSRRSNTERRYDRTADRSSRAIGAAPSRSWVGNAPHRRNGASRRGQRVESFAEDVAAPTDSVSSKPAADRPDAESSEESSRRPKRRRRPQWAPYR